VYVLFCHGSLQSIKTLFIEGDKSVACLCRYPTTWLPSSTQRVEERVQKLKYLVLSLVAGLARLAFSNAQFTGRPIEFASL